MKTTIYGLLGMVKDDKAPSKIKYNDYEYRYHDKKHGYCRSGYDCTYICLNTDYCLFNILNDEVEIIEEEKKIPEKLPYYYSMKKIQKAKNKDEWQGERITLLEKRVDDLHIKMNDLLDYLKSKGDE